MVKVQKKKPKLTLAQRQRKLEQERAEAAYKMRNESPTNLTRQKAIRRLEDEIAIKNETFDGLIGLSEHEIYQSSYESDLSDSDNSSESSSDNFNNSVYYIYESKDLESFSIAELLEIYEDRFEYCQTEEALAELLALLDVVNDAVTSYQPWKDYLQHPDVIRFKAQRHRKGVSERTQITAHNIEAATEQFLNELWAIRNSWELDKTEATLVLRELRYRKRIDSLRADVNVVARSPLITALFPFEDPNNQKPPLSEFEINNPCEVPERKTVTVKNRPNQSAFREKLFSHHGECCMISKTTVKEAIDAAHIIPYMGEYSNILENGECKNICVNGILNNIEEGYQNANIRQTHRPAA